MNPENEDLLAELKPVQQSAPSSLWRTVVSMGIFIAVDYWIFKSWAAVILLVSVILIHELGHFTAMKIFGYKAINMTFIPFMGAYVSGEATHFSKAKRIIMLLAGPIPGILIGMVILQLYHQNNDAQFYVAALAFLLLNTFNLLPVSPLDGGQFIETMFFNGNQLIQIVFLTFSLTVALYALYAWQSWFLIVVAWFILMRIRSASLTYQVRKALDRLHIAYDSHYDDLTDEHYAQIRDVLVRRSSLLKKRFFPGEYSSHEAELIPYIERILMPAYDHDLTPLHRILFLLIYLLGFILPLFQWALVKEWF